MRGDTKREHQLLHLHVKVHVPLCLCYMTNFSDVTPLSYCLSLSPLQQDNKYMNTMHGWFRGVDLDDLFGQVLLQGELSFYISAFRLF